MSTDTPLMPADAAAPAAKAGSTWRGLRTRGAALLFGVLVAAFVVLVPGTNSICAAAMAVAWTVLAVGFVDWAVFHARRFIVARLILAGLIGGGFGHCCLLTDTVAFDLAFGSSPPPAVRDIRTTGHYAGPLFDGWILMQFTVDEAALDELLSHRRFVRDAYDERAWRDEPAEIWRARLGYYAESCSPGSFDVRLPARVRVYCWGNEDRLEGTTMVWDEDSGRTYVRYTLW